MASSSAVADLGKRLLEASRKGTAEEVSHLMATGAPLTTDWLGTSPLHLAAQYGHATTADVLLRAGVSRDGKTKVDKTPLHLACQHGHLEIVKLLVKHGADVHVCDMLSMTPLHWTCERDYPEIAQILLEAGARKDIKNKFGKTPMDIARGRGHARIIQLLKQDYTQSVGERKKHETESFSFEVRKRAKTRKFPMTAGSWGGGDTSAEHDRQRQEKFRKSLHMKRRSSESEDALRLDGDRMDPENNLSSLVSAAAIVRSKSIDDPKLTAVTAALSQNAADASVLDTLATLATCAASGTQILSNAQAVPAIAPGYITLSNFHGLQANGGNLVATSPLGANIHTGLLGGIQLAPPITLNVIQGSRLPVGQPLIASSALPQVVAPNIMTQAATPTAVAQVVSRDGTQLVTAAGSGGGFAIDVGGGNLTQTVQLAGQDPSKSSEAPLNGQSTTLSIVGTVPSQSSGKHALSNHGATTPSIVTVATSNAIQQAFPHTFFQTAGVPQGSIPVNIPVSLLNSLIAGGVVHAQGGIPDEVTSTLLPRVPSSEATCVTSSLSTAPSSAVKVPSPQPTLVAGSPTPIPVVPLTGLGGVQLIPNQALFPQQFVTTIRPITPLSGATPMLQQQQILTGGTIPIPVTPVNLSSILPTAVSLSQLPIAQHQVVTSGHLGSQGNASIPIIPGFQIDQGFLSTTKTSPLPSTTGSAVLSLQNFVRQETSLPRRTLQILNPSSSPLVTVTSRSSKAVDVTSGLNLISALAPMVAEETGTRSNVCTSNIKDSRGPCEGKGSPTSFASTKHDATQKRQLFPQLQQLINQHQLMEVAETQELPETSLLDDRLDDDGKERSDGSEQFESQLITPRVMGGTPSDNDSASLASGSPERENNNQPSKISSEFASMPTIASVSSCRSPEHDVTSGRVTSGRLSLLRVIEPARREELSREELKKQLAEAERKTEQYRERLEKAQREISQREEREKQKTRLEVGMNAKASPPASLGPSAMPTITLASPFSLGAQPNADEEAAQRRENTATD